MVGGKLKKTAVFVGKEQITQDHLWPPLAEIFKNNLWKVKFCKNGKTEGDLGFYCEDKSLPGRQKFSVITLNGLDQDHALRPNYTEFFSKENWGLFDVGLLPGERWIDGWSARQANFYNTPRLGVLTTGWFKGDRAVKKYARPFEKKNNKTLLYAPQTEQDGKQKQVVDAAVGAGMKLKIKHWEQEKMVDLFPRLLTSDYMKNLTAENAYASQFRNVEIICPTENFMNTLCEVDLLITDQSSVLYEAAMLNIPSLTCYGWRHACGICKGPQPSPDITLAIEQNDLKEYFLKFEENYPTLLKNVKKVRNHNFTNLGTSSKTTFEKLTYLYEQNIHKSNVRRIRTDILASSLKLQASIKYTKRLVKDRIFSYFNF